MQLAETAADAEHRRLTEKLASQLFITVPEAAILLCADRRTIYKALEAGEMPGIKTGVFWKIPTAWLREQAGLSGGGDAAA